MARGADTLRRTGTTVPRVQAMRYATGQTFKAFAWVVIDTNGEVVECADGATSITGLALQGAGTGPGYDLPDASRTVVITGANQEVSVALADREQEFSMRGVNGGTDPVVPLQTHIGEQYGLKKVVNDWVIDFSNTTDKAVQITDIFVDDSFFAVKVLESVLAQP